MVTHRENISKIVFYLRYSKVTFDQNRTPNYSELLIFTNMFFYTFINLVAMKLLSQAFNEILIEQGSGAGQSVDPHSGRLVLLWSTLEDMDN